MLSLAQALAALPDTADGIAAHLTALGRRGVRGDSCNCPITNYLTGEGFDSVVVGDYYVIAVGDGVREVVDTPDHIASFIIGFDHGAWPDLVSDPAGATDA